MVATRASRRHAEIISDRNSSNSNNNDEPTNKKRRKEEDDDDYDDGKEVEEGEITLSLTEGGVRKIVATATQNQPLATAFKPMLKPIFQVIRIKQVGITDQNIRYRVVLSDGTHFVQGMMATQNNHLFETDELKQNSVISVHDYMNNIFQNRIIIILVNIQILGHKNEMIGRPIDIEKAGGAVIDVVPSPPSPSSMDLLPREVLEQIFLYLDSTRTVYNLSVCSKSSRLAITPEIVIRSAVFQGGKAKGAVESIMNAVMKKKIHVPSTFRMLRLVNGMKCEQGTECFGFDLERNTSTSMPNTTKRPWGLMICDACVHGLGMNTGSWNHSIWYKEPVPGEHRSERILERICLHNCKLLSCHSHREEATDEVAGPLIHGRTIKQIESTKSEWNARKQLLQDKFTTMDQAETQVTRNRAEAFVNAFTSATDKYDAFVESQFEVERSKQKKKQAARAEQKIKKARVVFADVKKQLSKDAHRSTVLACQWDETTGICTFDNKLSQNMLGPLLSAPSSATKKRIKEAVDTVRVGYKLVAEKGLFGRNFRTRRLLIGDSDHSADKAIIQHCCLSKSPEELLASAGRGILTILQDQGSLAEALFKILDTSNLKEICVFQVSSVGRRHQWKHIVAALWDRLTTYASFSAPPNGAHVGWSDNIGPFRVLFGDIEEQVQVIRRNYTEYMQFGPTVAFLDEDGPPAHRPNQRFNRYDAIAATFIDRPHFTADCLKSRRFGALLTSHRSVFDHPRAYGRDPNIENIH